MGLDPKKLELIKQTFDAKLNAFIAKYGQISFEKGSTFSVYRYLERSRQSDNQKQKAAATAMLRYLNTINTYYKNLFDGKEDLNLDSESIKPNLLLEFFESKNFEDVDSAEAQGLTELFHLLNDSFSNLVSSEAKEICSKAPEKINELKEMKIAFSKERNLFVKELTDNENINFYLKEHTKEHINKLLDEENEKNDKILKETEAEIERYKRTYGFGQEGAEKKLEEKYHDLEYDVRKTEEDLRTFNQIHNFEQVYKQHHEYAESKEFEGFLEYDKLGDELSRLEKKLAKSNTENAELARELYKKENVLRMNAYEKHDEALSELNDEEYDLLGRFIDVKQYADELHEFVVTKKNKNYNSLSEEIRKLRVEKNLTIEELYAHYLKELNDIRGKDKYNTVLNENNVEAAMFMADEDNVAFAEEYKEKQAQLDIHSKKRKALENEVNSKKEKLLPIKKEFAEKCLYGLSDEELEKTSFKDIGKHLKNLCKEDKQKVENIKNLPEYKKLEQELKDQIKLRDENDPSVLSSAYENLLSTRDKALLQKNRIEVLKNKNEELETKLNGNNEKIIAAKTEISKGLNVKESTVINNIQTMLKKYEGLLRENDRKKNSPEFVQLRITLEHLNGLFDPQQTLIYFDENKFGNYLLIPALKNAGYSSSFINNILAGESFEDILINRLPETERLALRASLRAAKEEYLDKERRLYLDQLAEDADNYLRVRSKDTVIFPDKTRKYRLSLVKDLLAFSNTAIVDYENVKTIEAERTKAETANSEIEAYSYDEELRFANTYDVDLEKDSKLEQDAASMIDPEEQKKKDAEFALNQKREDLKTLIKTQMNPNLRDGNETIKFDGENLVVMGEDEGKQWTYVLSKEQFARHIFYSYTLDLVDNVDPSIISDVLDPEEMAEEIKTIVDTDAFKLAEYYIDEMEGVPFNQFLGTIKSEISGERKDPKQKSRAFYSAVLNEKIESIMPRNNTAVFKTEENEQYIDKRSIGIDADDMARFAALQAVKRYFDILPDNEMSKMLSDQAIDKDAKAIKELPSFNKMIEEFLFLDSKWAERSSDVIGIEGRRTFVVSLKKLEENVDNILDEICEAKQIVADGWDIVEKPNAKKSAEKIGPVK